MKMLILLITGLLLSTTSHARITELYETKLGLTEDDLIVEVNGYKVPTRDAFEGWLLINQAHDKVRKIGQYFIDNQYIRLHLSSNGKTQPHFHAGTV